MENNNNRNYNQDDRNYTNERGTTDFDPNQEYRNPEQYEEFNDDQNPNSNYDSSIHPDGIEDVNWENENDQNPNTSETPDPVYDPEDDFEKGGITEEDLEDEDLDDEDEIDVDDEDLNEESDFDSTFNEPDVDIEDDDDEDDLDDEDDEIDSENLNQDDDWLNRKV